MVEIITRFAEVFTSEKVVIGKFFLLVRKKLKIDVGLTRSTANDPYIRAWEKIGDPTSPSLAITYINAAYQLLYLVGQRMCSFERWKRAAATHSISIACIYHFHIFALDTSYQIGH